MAARRKIKAKKVKKAQKSEAAVEKSVVKIYFPRFHHFNFGRLTLCFRQPKKDRFA